MTPQPSQKSNNAPTLPMTIKKRRKSSFNSSDSPYARRRSFLSKSMLENDNFQTYELSYYATLSPASSSPSGSLRMARIPSFSINLTESQGFIWNQDLFASSYQQARAGLNPNSFQGDSQPVEVIDIVVDSSDEMDDEACAKTNLRGENTTPASANYRKSCQREVSMNDDIFDNGAELMYDDDY
ncbi:hypothetical protein FOA43_000357 [Brettanomyces nanus]|uniref:Uncharacterized protein n=1 Tax=Eeniella nana TaxID=13502 RepID=A0A875RX09_EENNA|nr:uncharacterized protein FOA43_000357 [Brettanomyces nanus]QPG73053.1 hypothetical protein FOA43_000357 [Brettanomyces nanus]